MADFDGGFSSGRPFVTRLALNVMGQSVDGNSSVLGWTLNVIKTGNETPWSNNQSTWAVSVDGQNWSGTFTFDFRNVPVGSAIGIASQIFSVGHNSDGSKQVGVATALNMDQLGTSGPGGTMTLPSIPRASQVTISASSMDAGSAIRVYTNRVSASFTHTIKYQFGNESGNIASGVTDSADWTIPMNLLYQIPNATSGVGTITVDTYNGSTYVGSSSIPVTVTVPASVVPTISGVNHYDLNTGAANNIGAYVQNVSYLRMAMQGVNGSYGSSVLSGKLQIAGQVINGLSGDSGAIQASGTIGIIATVTDSRGRSFTRTVNINVMAYSVPYIHAPSWALLRSNAAGVVQELGTYVKAMSASQVTSLVVGGAERNALGYRLYSRKRGATEWISKATAVIPQTSFNTPLVVGTYPVEESHEFRLDIWDRFSTTSIQGTVATGTIFMHWAKEGLGIGKFWERGSLDVAGPVFHKNGFSLGSTQRVPIGGDLNTVKTTGTYDVDQCTNTPMGSNTWFYLRVTEHSNGIQNYVEQVASLFWNTNVPQMWRRVCDAGNWSPWYEVGGVPPGTVIHVAGAVPAGYLPCNGGNYFRAQFPALFAAIGTQYGSVNAERFNVPNTLGRTIVGANGAETEFNALGKTGGSKTHTLVTNEIPSHQHGYDINASTAQFTTPGGTGMDNRGSGNALTRPTGGGAAHNNLQPFIAFNDCIKY